MKKEAKKEEKPKTEQNSFGVASAILGIFSLMSSVPLYGIISGIIAVVFANKQNKIKNNGWSKAGLIMGILGIVLNILVWIFLIWLSNNPELLSRYGAIYGAQ